MGTEGVGAVAAEIQSRVRNVATGNYFSGAKSLGLKGVIVEGVMKGLQV